MNEREPKENAMNNNKVVINEISIYTHAISHFSIAKQNKKTAKPTRPFQSDLTYDFGISAGDSNVPNFTFLWLHILLQHIDFVIGPIFTHFFLLQKIGIRRQTVAFQILTLILSARDWIQPKLRLINWIRTHAHTHIRTCTHTSIQRDMCAAERESCYA